MQHHHFSREETYCSELLMLIAAKQNLIFIQIYNRHINPYVSVQIIFFLLGYMVPVTWKQGFTAACHPLADMGWQMSPVRQNKQQAA